jgi:hypothetical protein
MAANFANNRIGTVSPLGVPRWAMAEMKSPRAAYLYTTEGKTMGYTKLGRVICVALVASVFSADAQAQRGFPCVTRYRFCDGCDTYMTWTVHAGKVCALPYLTAFSPYGRTGGDARSPTAIFSQRVVVRPRGGIYGTANPTWGAYKANPGFVGSDSFQVDIEYEKQGQRFVTHVKANVNVLP